MADADDSDEDYDFVGDPHHQLSIEKKYPIHDCCEFDDVDKLKVRCRSQQHYVQRLPPLGGSERSFVSGSPSRSCHCWGEGGFIDFCTNGASGALQIPPFLGVSIERSSHFFFAQHLPSRPGIS